MARETTGWRRFLPGMVERWILGLILLIALIAFAFSQRDYLFQGTHILGDANKSWIVVAVLAALGSMFMMALMMHTLLKAAGLDTTIRQTFGLSLVSNAWSTTFPGGAAVSAAIVFREQFKWGATPVIAGWYLIISGLLQSAGLALIGLVAFFWLGASVSVTSLIISIGVLIAVILGIRWVTQHLDIVEKVILKALHKWNDWRHNPVDQNEEKIQEIVSQFSSVKVSPQAMLGAFTFSTLNWVLELFCLIACLWAVNAEFSIPGALISFVTAKLVASTQLTPGGLGTVDAALVGTLTAAAGVPFGVAFAAVFCYRMITLVGMNILGWVIVLVQTLPGFKSHKPEGESESLDTIIEDMLESEDTDHEHGEQTHQ